MPDSHAKCALVTGGARGIGRATAELLVARGWKVALADRDAGAGREAASACGATFVECDVSSEPSVEACVRAAAAALGGLGALVNNAGTTGAASLPPEQLSLEEWNRRIGTNLTGVFLMAKHCAPLLRAARGAIVNIASTRALQSEPNTEASAPGRSRAAPGRPRRPARRHRRDDRLPALGGSRLHHRPELCG